MDNLLKLPGLNKKRKKFTKMQKLLFDEVLYFQGMAHFAKYHRGAHP